MGEIVRKLLPTKKLKTRILKEVAQKKRIGYIRYDSDLDTLMLLFVSPEKETIVHYLGDDIALLYDPDTREIVGFQIEAFKKSFLPEHAGVQRVWKLSEAAGIKDFGDMIIKVEKTQPIITREIFKASGNILKSIGLPRALRNSLINNNLVPA